MTEMDTYADNFKYIKPSARGRKEQKDSIFEQFQSNRSSQTSSNICNMIMHIGCSKISVLMGVTISIKVENI